MVRIASIARGELAEAESEAEPEVTETGRRLSLTWTFTT